MGATAILFREQPTPDTLFALVERYRPTVLTNVPTLINKMLRWRARRTCRASDDVERRRALLARAVPSVEWCLGSLALIIDGIGSAESFHIYISNRPGDIRPGSLGKLVLRLCGRPARRCRADRRRRDRCCAHPGTPRHPTVMATMPSRSATCGGAIVSGDLFRRDPEGYWYYRPG